MRNPGRVRVLASVLAIGRLLFMFAAMLLIAGPVCAGGVELHVGPFGNDEWSGRLAAPNADRSDGPLATIGRCQTMVRELLAGPDKPGPITVTIHGTHRLDQPLGSSI